MENRDSDYWVISELYLARLVVWFDSLSSESVAVVEFVDSTAVRAANCFSGVSGVFRAGWMSSDARYPLG